VTPTLPPRHPRSFTPYGSGLTVGMTPLSAMRWVTSMEVFLLAAIYLAMSLSIAFLTRRLEVRFARGQAHV
jgi:hypothetical protein